MPRALPQWSRQQFVNADHRIVDFLAPSATPLQSLAWPLARRSGVDVLVKREDLIHPLCSGNKWYKLLENIAAMRARGYRSALSFGGGYSNHLHALAHVGQLLNLNTVGVVRGYYTARMTPTLRDCQAAGMTLHYLTREQWRERQEPYFLAELQSQFADSWLIPEGGDNTLGFMGCRLLGQKLRSAIEAELNFGANPPPVVVLVACGTGTTLAGLVAEMPNYATVLGVSVLRGADTLTPRVAALLGEAGVTANCCWRVLTDWHAGGYGKCPPYLVDFINRFAAQQSLLLDPVYTAKVFFAVEQMLQQRWFQPGSKVVVVHTGGLQGRRGVSGLM